MEGFLLRVTPEQLIAVADSAEDAVNKVDASVRRISENIKASSSYWEGEGATQHLQKGNAGSEAAQEIISRLKDRIDHLREIGGVYQSHEGKAVEMAGYLSSDVIL